jgi:hypothetical protein
MEITQVASKGRHMNITEKHHIICTQKQNKQMSEWLFDLNNSVFKAIYRSQVSIARQRL